MPHELNITLTIFISKNNDRKMENNKLKLTTKSKLMNNKSHKKLKKNTIAADTLIQFHQTQQRGTAALVHKKSCTFFFSSPVLLQLFLLFMHTTIFNLLTIAI